MSEPTDLNVRGLLCPMPVIRTQDKIKHLTNGQQLRVFATDPGTLHDIPAWCRVHGHAVLEQKEVDRDYIFIIEVAHSD